MADSVSCLRFIHSMLLPLKKCVGTRRVKVSDESHDNDDPKFFLHHVHRIRNGGFTHHRYLILRVEDPEPIVNIAMFSRLRAVRFVERMVISEVTIRSTFLGRMNWFSRQVFRAGVIHTIS